MHRTQWTLELWPSSTAPCTFFTSNKNIYKVRKRTLEHIAKFPFKVLVPFRAVWTSHKFYCTNSIPSWWLSVLRNKFGFFYETNRNQNGKGCFIYTWMWRHTLHVCLTTSVIVSKLSQKRIDENRSAPWQYIPWKEEVLNMHDVYRSDI